MYASRVNLPGLALEVSALATDQYPPELVTELAELCSITLNRFVELVDHNTAAHERSVIRRQEEQAMLKALSMAAENPPPVPYIADPWGTGPSDDDSGEPPC